jgi:C-terminal processing protease CtpA/Prc
MFQQIKLIITILFTSITVLTSCAQNSNNKITTQKNIAFLISMVQINLKQQYFDKSKADILSNKLAEMEREKLFDGVTTEVAAQMITNMLRKETNDKHFNIIAYKVNPQTQQAPAQAKPFTAGINSIKILKDNIGYLRWDACIAGEEAFKKIRSALDSLASCKQIIIDISENPGGDGASSAFINQFFYKSKAYQTLLIKKCTKDTDWHQSEVIFNYTEGPVFFDIPLYIILSDKTASAAEYFAFTAKEMKRATILGKTSAGAGNPGNATGYSLNNSDTAFWMFIPNCQIKTRAGHSIEGIGVKPDKELVTNDWVKETVDYITSRKTFN